MDYVSNTLINTRKLFPNVKYKPDEPMSSHTSFKIGGPVRAMFIPGSADELTRLYETLADGGINPFIMGNGTNLLVDDAPLDMVVIKTTELCAIEQTGETEITAESGTSLAKLALFASERGLSGLEFAHGIPGTLGGAISMNAGAYGSEMKDIVHSTKAFDPKSGIYAATCDEHGFYYRRSRFSDTSAAVLSSTIHLQKGDPNNIAALMRDLSARRHDSQPLAVPSAGSTFKRPKEGYAAKLIEEAGLKGYTIGGAQVSAKHAGFIINTGAATFNDVMSLIAHVQEAVHKQYDINLEPEVKIITRHP